MVNPSSTSPHKVIGLLSPDQTLIKQFQSIIPHVKVLNPQNTLTDTRVDLLFIDDEIDNFSHLLSEFNIPTVLLTDPTTNSLTIGLDANITDYIPKPISPALLQHRLQQLSNIVQPSTSYSNNRQLTAYQPKMVLDRPISVAILTDHNHIITFWDESAEELYGWRADEVLGQSLDGLLPTIYPESSKVDKINTLESGKPWHGEIVQSSKQGIPKYVLASITPIHEADVLQGYLTVTHDLTGSQQILSQLEENTIRLERIYDQIQAMLVVIDDNGIIVRINQQVLDETGYQESEMIGHPLTRFLPDTDAHKFRQELQDYVDTNILLTDLLLHLRCANNRTLETVIEIVKVLDGKFRHFHLVILRNITAQRKVEQSLLETETEFQSLISGMSDPIFVFDEHGTYTKIPAVRTTNYYISPDRLLGKTLHDIFSQETADKFLATIQQVINTQSTQVINYDLEIDDQLIYFSAAVNPIEGRSEVVWVSRDVTRSRLNDLAVAETEKRYRQLFENANDMLLIVDLESGQILDANKQTQRQLGYTHEELTKMNIADIEEPMQDTKNRIVTRTLASTGHIIYEQKYVKKDNTTIPVETSTQISDYHGRSVLLSFARNIKQRKLAMQAEAEERYFAEILRDTISRLAHTQTIESVLDVIMSTVTKVVNSDMINIMLIDNDNVDIIRSRGYQDTDSLPKLLNISSMFTLRYMYENRQGIIISDTDNDPRWNKLAGENLVKSYVGAPIILKSDVIGFINLDSNVPNHFTNKHRQRLQVFADQVAIAIENARLYESTQRYTEDLEASVTERTAELTQINQELTQQIEKRQRAEDKLAEERNLLRTILDSLPVSVYVKNRKSEYTLSNRFPYLSIDEQQIIGKSDLDLLQNKDVAREKYEEEQQLMARKETSVREEYTVTPHGGEQWSIITKVPLYDENGEVIGLVGVRQDITQIKLAERQLHQLLSSATCLLWSATVDRVDDKFKWFVHIENENSANDFLPFDTTDKDYTRAWLDSIPEEDQSLRETVANTYLQHNQQNYKLEYRCITEDGKEHWLNEDVQIRQVTDTRWNLVGVSLDISDIKFAEFALREAYEQMEQRVVARTTELQEANQELQQEIITRQRAEEAERRQRILAEALQDSITALNNTLNIDDVLDAVLDAMKVTVEHDASNIMLIEKDMLVIVRQRGYPSRLPSQIPLDAIPDVPLVYQTQKPHVIHNTLEDNNWNDDEAVYGYISWIRSNVKIPIIYNDVVIGIMMLDSSRMQNFSDEQIDLLQTFANQASIALNNARLYQAEHQQRILAETLQVSLKALNNTLNIDDVFDAVLDSIQENVEHKAASIMLVEGDEIQIVRSRGYTSESSKRHAISKFAEVPSILKSKQPYIINDTQTYDAWMGTQHNEWIRCNIKIPILQDEQVIGLINLDSPEPNKFTLYDAEILQAFTNQASIALKNAQLYQQAQAEIAERKRAEDAERQQRIFAETIRDTAITLNQQLNSNDLFETILQTIGQVIQEYDTASIISIDPSTMIGTVIKDVGFEDFGGSVVGLKIDLNQSQAKQILIEQRSPSHIPDTHNSDVWIELDETAWIRSHISLPIYIQDEILALINLDSQYPNTFTEEHVNQLLVLSHQVAIALQNAKLMEQIQGYAHELESRVNQRTAELENERALLQLERSQLRAILNAMRDGLYFTDTNHQPVYINNALVELTGYAKEKWLNGEVFKSINQNIDIDREELWKTIERHLNAYRFYHNEDILTRADGSTFIASITRTEVRGIDDKRVGIVTVVRDISNEKQLEDQKSRFIAHAAHELRTPITNIKTRLFLMKHKPENILEHLRIAESSANWMQTLVDNLFDQSRFERGLIQLELDEFVLQDIANSIVETQYPEAQKKHINLISDWDKTPIMITADESRIRQVITNLTNNAISYTPEGGSITIAIKPENMANEPSVTISVHDTGIGIASEHLPYLFQPFYRATDDNKGTGLGLSIAREIVEAHHGTIDVDSTPGEGTTFYISLPLLPEPNNIEEV